MNSPYAPVDLTGDEIGARLATWQRTRDDNELWPHVSEASRLAAFSEVATITQATLRSVPGARSAEWTPPESIPQAALAIAGFVTGVGALLGHWLETGRLQTTAPVASVFRLQLDHVRRRRSLLDAQLVTVVAALNRSGIEPTLLKGAHTDRAYLPPGTRPATDLDLLILPEELQGACEALRHAGYTEQRRTRRPFRSEWRPAGGTQRVRSLELDHPENPWSIDLHVDLNRYYGRGLHRGLGRTDQITTVPLEGMGCECRVLAQPYLAAHLALHASYDVAHLQLIRIVELVLVIRRDATRQTLTWKDLRNLLAQTNTTRFVYPALALAEHLLPGTVEPVALVATERAAPARMRRVVAEVAASPGWRLRTRSLEDRLVWARGPVEVLLALSDVIWPSDKGQSLEDRLWMLWRRVSLLARGRASIRVGQARLQRRKEGAQRKD